MLQLKEIRLIIVSAVVASMLSGCITPRPDTSSSTSQAPVRTSQDLQREQPPLPASVQGGQPSTADSSRVSSLPPVSSARLAEKSDEIQVDYADMEFVQQRLHEYQYKYDQWLETYKIQKEKNPALEIAPREAECSQTIERILTGYALLLERMQQNETVPVEKIATVNPGKMQQLDIAFLESRCSEILGMDIPAQRDDFMVETKPELSFDETQKTIVTNVELGNYLEALSDFSSLPQYYPGQKPAIATELSYGLALLYTGQVEEAAQQFKQMLVSDDLSVAPLSMQLKIADLHLANGDLAGAESYYENFILAQKSVAAEKSWAEEQLAFLRSIDPGSEDMRAYTQLLKDFQISDYRIHAAELNEKVNRFAATYAGRPIAVSALRLKNFTIAQLHTWFGRQLIRIDSLVAEKKFAEATEILKNMTHYYLPAELQAVVQKTYYDVAQVEIQETETQRRIQEMELTEQWDSAVHLLDSQQYGAAILAFEALAGTEYEEDAKLKITEAANLAAGQMRKDAASLFIRAGKTSDIEKKKELLVASHQLLHDILVKYPQTELLEKVNQNINILEEQIRKFDPALLEELDAENHSAGMPEESSVPITRQLQ